jgi:hypothetical protein
MFFEDSILSDSGAAKPKGLERATQIDTGTFQKLAENYLASTLPPNVVQRTMQLQQLSYELVRESMGQTKIFGEEIMANIANASFESAQYGLTLDDHFETQKSINEVMQRNTMLTEEESIQMGLLARNAGLTNAEIAEMVGGFDSIGVGMQDALDKISGLEKQARTYGLNVGQFMKNIAGNVKLLSGYNFKNGVEGLSKMVARAQSLRMDINDSVKLSADLLSPEKAIETAAGFQMLGGAIGDLGDPFKLLHMAQNDVGGLQDAIIGMAESAVVFNEKTGEFDIPVTEMYRLREAARLTGMEYTELASTAIKSAERTTKVDMMEGLGFTEEQKEMLANLSDLDQGKVTFDIPGFEKITDFSEISEGQLKKLEDYQKEMGKSDKEIALDQSSFLDKQVKYLEVISEQLSLITGVNNDLTRDLIEAGGVSAEEYNRAFTKMFGEEKADQINDILNDAIKNGLSIDSVVDAAKMYMDMYSEFNEGVDTSRAIEEKTDSDNYFHDKGIDDIIKNLIGVPSLEYGDELIEHLKQELVSASSSTGSSGGGRGGGAPTMTPSTLDTTGSAGPTAGINSIEIDPMSMAVAGEINLNLNGLNSVINEEELTAMIMNNPEFIPAVKRELTNANNTYSA